MYQEKGKNKSKKRPGKAHILKSLILAICGHNFTKPWLGLYELQDEQKKYLSQDIFSNTPPFRCLKFFMYSFHVR